jgi:tetratricopeptide (TPR) repeat protein
MGTLFERELRWTDAREWYEKAVTANPRSAAHHSSFATALTSAASTASMMDQMSLGKKAIAEYELAVGLDSTLLEPHVALAQIYLVAPAFLGGGVDKAEAQIEKITRLNPMRGHMQRGAFRLQRGDTTGAEQEYLAAIASAPDSTAARYRIASFYRTRQQWPSAFAVYDSVRRRAPKDPLLSYGFGVTAAASGQQLDRGEKDLRSWIGKPPADVSFAQLAIAHYALGQIAERRGKIPEAKKEYEATLRFNGEHRDAKKALERLK